MPEYRLTRLRGMFAITYSDSEGKRHRHSTGTADAIEAARILDDYKAKLSRPKAINIDGILDAYLKSLGERAWGSVAVHQAKALRRFFGKLSAMQCDEKKIIDYVKERTAIGRAQQTIRNEVSLLASALNHAVNKRLIPERPHIAFPQGSPPRDLYLTRDQFKSVLSGCQTLHVRLFIALAIATGARMTAITELTWDRVDFERGQIDLRTTRFTRMKGRAVVPMTDSVRKELEMAFSMRISGFVIEHGGKPVASPHKGVRAAGMRIGIDRLSPHVFRHSAARWMAEDGVPMPEISQYLGHKSVAITESVYARFSPNYLKKAAKSLDFWC